MPLPPSSELLADARSYKPRLESFLVDLIGIPSTYGREGDAQIYVRDSFERLGLDVDERLMSDALKKDPEYTHTDNPVPREGRPNLVIDLGGNGEGGSLILNTHSDVVPAGSWDGAFEPTVCGDVITGRGAVDCKGHIGALLLLSMLLEDFSVKLRGGLKFQVVVEEEIGGNGSLSLIRQGQIADGAVVLEGTDFTVCPANRGALWFRATVGGRPVHMAKKYEGVSAIDKSFDLIKLLYAYEGRLAEEIGNQSLFSEYRRPVQVNIGRMEAGDWPATVPALSILEGGVGFLPNRSLDTIREDLRSILDSDEWLSEHGSIDFDRLHNDAYQIPTDHPLVLDMVESAEKAGVDTRVRGMIASCDARLFNRVGGMPTIVFGAGDIDQAHSRGESVSLDDLVREACTLFYLVCSWCGTDLV